jgi:hypothetical protein
VSVYFVSARELDLIKIGYAFNPVSRFRSLRTMCPVDLTLEGAIPGDFAKERELHRKFAEARVRGEWFRLCPNLQAEIDASSRPEKYTWASVRKWLKELASADEIIERKKVPPEVAARADKRIQDALDTAASRRSMTTIQRLEADGHIHFPFRARAAA